MSEKNIRVLALDLDGTLTNDEKKVTPRTRAALLVFASCSSRVTADQLFAVVKETAASAGRPLTELERTAHAVDHPARFRESSYLKCMYAEVK